MRAILAVALSVFAMSSAGLANQSHVALVVGNGLYDHMSDLPNAERDAELMARMFERLGYHTTLVTNASRAQMLDVLTNLRKDSEHASQVIFYFSGHGFQSDGHSALLFRGANPSNAANPKQMLRLDTVFRAVSDKPRQKIFFLDTCQTDLQADTSSSFWQTDEVTAGSYVAYASQPGRASYDGSGPVSPFARALACSWPNPVSRFHS